MLFKESSDNEVLYENTGVSHYIVRQFKEDIFDYKKPEDFLNTIDTEDILNKKRYYTYRTLLFYPVFNYSNFDLEIYNYFINYRNRIINDINNLLDGDLLIYKDVALLTTVEKTSRINFPNSRKMIHDIVLLVNDYIVNELNNLVLNNFEFEQLLIKVHRENNMYFNKEFREMKDSRFFMEVKDVMEKFGLLKVDNDMYYFSPTIYLITGNYQKEIVEDNNIYEQISIDLEV